ncbi:hypothetical protein [Phenylobacterium sp.]|uniref:hypothetical protein n=1 Tax=Phenylobacterium sp. TaxID=1871053 RepID=UPI0030F386AD
MKLRWGFLGIGVACLACCAPLILPVLAGAGLVSLGVGGAGMMLFGLTLDQVLCFGVPALGILALAFLWWRDHSRAKAAQCGCEEVCDAQECKGS